MELIYTLLGLSPFFLAVLVVLGCFAAVIGACNDFRVGLWVLACTYVLDTMSLGAPLLYVGLLLYTTDLPMVLLAAAAAVRWIASPQVPRRHPAWLLFALGFLAALALGLMLHGTQAGVQARPEFNALAAASYALSFPIRREQLKSLLVALAWVAVVLALLSVYRWIVTFVPITSLLPPGDAYNIDTPVRVVNSNIALLLAQVGLLGVFFFGSGLAPLVARIAAPGLLMATLALQHRSVWLAALVGVCVSLLVARSSRTPWWQQILLIGVAAVAVSAPLVLSSSLLGQVQTSATRAVQGQDTVIARFENWRATVSDWVREGPVAIAVGSPPGGDTTRVYKADTGKTVAIGFGTHNNYVNMLTSRGLLGLTTWVWLVGLALLVLWRARRAGGEPAEAASMLFVLLCSQLAYYIAYDVDYVQAFILGTVLAWVFQHQREAASVGQPAGAGTASAPGGVYGTQARA